MTQVAAEAGVSVMSVSYTYGRPERVSPEVRNRVLQAAERLGFAGPDPRARSLRRGRSGTLGVVLGEHLTYAFDDPQATAFLGGIAEVCAAEGLGMTILPTSGSDDDVQRVREASVDAFVVWTTTADDPVLDAIRSARRPAALHQGPQLEGFSLVYVDDEAAAAAVSAITFARSERPLILSFPLDRRRQPGLQDVLDPDTVPYPVTRNRLRGMLATRPDARVLVCSNNDDAEAERLVAEVLDAPHLPDAIAAMGDRIAMGALRAASHRRLSVPEDLALSGWDDSADARQHDLTTVHQDLRDQGRECARAAIAGTPVSVRADWSIERRASTQVAERREGRGVPSEP